MTLVRITLRGFCLAVIVSIVYLLLTWLNIYIFSEEIKADYNLMVGLQEVSFVISAAIDLLKLTSDVSKNSNWE